MTDAETRVFSELRAEAASETNKKEPAKAPKPTDFFGKFADLQMKA